MSSLNRVMLIGNLTRDPESRTVSSGSMVCELALAINRTWTEPDGQKREEVTYVEVTFWGRTAESAAKYLAKGRSVFIEGRLQLDTWQDAQTGQERQRLKVVGERLQFLGGGSQAIAGQGNFSAEAEGSPGAAPAEGRRTTPRTATPRNDPPPRGGQSAPPRPRYQGRAA